MRTLFFLLCLLPQALFAQFATLQGQISDTTGEALIGATVKLLKDGALLKGSIADAEGRYRIAIEPGSYILEVNYTGFSTLQLKGIQIRAGQLNAVDVVLENLAEPIFIGPRCYWPPLLDQTPGNAGTVLRAEQLRRFF